MWCVPRDPSRARKSFGLLCTLVLCTWTSSVRGAAKEEDRLFSSIRSIKLVNVTRTSVTVGFKSVYPFLAASYDFKCVDRGSGCNDAALGSSATGKLGKKVSHVVANVTDLLPGKEYSCYVVTYSNNVQVCEKPLDIATLSKDVARTASCGPFMDGTLTTIPMDAIQGLGAQREGSCIKTASAEEGLFLSAQLGPWFYNVDSVRVRLSKDSAGEQLSAYLTRVDWMKGKDLLLNKTLTLQDFKDASTLLGTESISSSGDAYILNSSFLDGQFVSLVSDSMMPFKVCGLEVCLRQKYIGAMIDQILTPEGVEIKNSYALDTGTSRQSAGDEISIAADRSCPGYPDVQCPNGLVCTGTYTPFDCGSDCVVLFGEVTTVPCADFDIELGKKSDCGKPTSIMKFFSSGSYTCPKQNICGKCDICQPEFVRAEILQMDYPKQATDFTPSSLTYESTTTVINRGNNAQKQKVSFGFTTIQTTTMKLEKKTADSSKFSLKIPIPKIGADLGIENTDSADLKDGESTSRAQELKLTVTTNINIPPKTEQVVSGKIGMASVATRVPMRIKVYKTCGEEEIVDNTAVLTTTGVSTGTDANVEITYGEQTKLE